jgi:hypothetical protein
MTDKWLILKDALTLSTMILSITIIRIIILSIITLRIMALSKMILIITILSMMVLGMTLRIDCRDAECQIFIVMLTVTLPNVAA